MNAASFGRKLLFGVNVATALNGLLADWNRTHLFNSKWPPHAKFHDGLSISLGVALGGVGLYALRRRKGDRQDNLRLAALCPALFFGAMLSAQAYPGAESIETEFPGYWPKVGRFSFNELPFAASFLALTFGAWKLASTEDRAKPARSADTASPELLDVVRGMRRRVPALVE